MSDQPATIAVAFTGGPLHSCSLPAVPTDTRLLYITFNATNREHIRWAAWTASQTPGTIPALVVDPGESVYVYWITARLNPVVRFKENDETYEALLFEFWSEGGSVQDTLEEDDGTTEGAQEATGTTEAET